MEFLKSAVELDNKESKKIIEKNYENNMMINEFIESHPFFTTSDIEILFTDLDTKNSTLQSAIEKFFKKENPRFDVDYLLHEDYVCLSFFIQIFILIIILTHFINFKNCYSN